MTGCLQEAFSRDRLIELSLSRFFLINFLTKRVDGDRMKGQLIVCSE